MARKVLMKALKGAESQEEMLELIAEHFGESEVVAESKKEEDDIVVEKEEVKEVEKKEDHQENDDSKDKEKENVDDNSNQVNDLIERVNQLEKDKKEQDKKIEEWETLANALAQDKPFGIVNKVQKREINQDMYDKYDADRIIGN